MHWVLHRPGTKYAFIVQWDLREWNWYVTLCSCIISFRPGPKFYVFDNLNRPPEISYIRCPIPPNGLWNQHVPIICMRGGSCVVQCLTHYVLSTWVFAIDTDPRKCLISIFFIMHSSDIKTFEEYAPQVLAEVPGGGPTEERSCSSEYFSCVSSPSKLPPPDDTHGKEWWKVGWDLSLFKKLAQMIIPVPTYSTFHSQLEMLHGRWTSTEASANRQMGSVP